jgi:hypothetical protein
MKLINFLTTDKSFVVFTIIHPTQASDSLLHGSLVQRNLMTCLLEQKAPTNADLTTFVGAF